MSRPIIQAWTRLQYGILNTATINTANKAKTLLYSQNRCMRLYKERTIRAMYWRGRSFDAIKFPVRRRDEWQEWNYRSEIYAFSRRLQEELSEDTLRRVFTHRSYIDKLESEQAKLDLPDMNLESNEKLIEKGRALLDSTLRTYFRAMFSKLPEEGIEMITNYLKSDVILAEIATLIGCKDIVLTAEYPPNEITLANTVLALMSGIENDSNLDRVRRFVVDFIVSYVNDKDILDDIWSIPNPKETLNLILVNNKLPSYEPRILFQTGIKTLEACHIIGLYVNKRLIGSSAGETIAIAEECAALESLRNLFDLTDYRKPYVYGIESEKIDHKAHEKEHDSLKNWKLNLEGAF